MSHNYNWSILEDACGNSKDLQACLREKTHSLSKTVHMELGLRLRESLMASELWREDFTNPEYGRSYTMFYPHLRGGNYLYDSIYLHFSTSDGLTRRIFIHDPNFFVLNMNPLGLPIKKIILSPRSGSFYYSLALREHRKLNTQNSPCVEDSDYSFTACVKESLSRNVGCRQMSDTLSEQSRPVCTTIEQFKAISKDFQYILEAPMEKILTKTSCNIPCRYKEYVVLEGPVYFNVTSHFYSSVDLWLVSTDTTVLTEILVYPWTSLLAEFGGTFSLFF